MDGEDSFTPAQHGSKHLNEQNPRLTNGHAFGALRESAGQAGIDLNEQLIKNKPATFFFRMKGDAMKDAGIFDNDLLIVDRSLKLVNGKIIVAILNGELLVRRFYKNFSSAFLMAENERFKSINLAEFTDFALWGVVTYVVHEV